MDRNYLCWLRQRDTYPATIVAPLSKGDAAAVTLVIYSLADTNGLQLRVPSSEGYGEAGGMYMKTHTESPYR